MSTWTRFLRHTAPLHFQWCLYLEEVFGTCEKMLQEGHGPDCEGRFTGCKEGMTRLCTSVLQDWHGRRNDYLST